MGSKKSIDSFQGKQKIDHLIFQGTIISFGYLLITFRRYYAKFMFLTSL